MNPTINETIINIQVQGFENAIITEDSKSYYIDLRTGLGRGEYPKDSWTLEEAIKDQVEFRME